MTNDPWDRKTLLERAARAKVNEPLEELRRRLREVESQWVDLEEELWRVSVFAEEQGWPQVAAHLRGTLALEEEGQPRSLEEVEAACARDLEQALGTPEEAAAEAAAPKPANAGAKKAPPKKAKAGRKAEGSAAGKAAGEQAKPARKVRGRGGRA